MESKQVARIRHLFGEALDRNAEERAAYLDDACAGSSELRGHVEALLADAENDDQFLREATLDAGALETGPVGEGVGTRIGPYKLLGMIGEGGFGSVYLAEQEEPVRRRVALKIIKLGMDTRAVVARFEQERQAMALMDHPNIARVLDAGATDSGRPYIVMELVKGEPITRYCDQQRLTIPERLALFVQVCQGIQHAHTKGVIHRDIKPTNVLVASHDSGPLARIIDFGVAKATAHRLTEKTVFTGPRQLVGTLEYMSPEQAEGSLDLDTRTDVYSLGVLLYEMLAGSTPLDPQRLQRAPFAELQRMIRDEDPSRPSTRIVKCGEAALDEVASRRRVEPRALGRILRGDLDWIVMRALEKDRARRYDTASSFAADIQRYLNGEAVAAAPPGAWYRVRRFARRHRVSVVAAGIVALSLFLGIVGTSIGLIKAWDQRDAALAAEALGRLRLSQAERCRADADDAREGAEKNNRIANAVTTFFTQDVLDLKPVPAGAAEPTVRQLLDAVPEKIDKYFKSDPAVEGIIRERVGQLYRRIGEIERSRQYLEDAVPLLETGLGPDHKQTLSAVHRLAELNMDTERWDRAAALFDKAYQGRLRAHGIDYSLTMGSLCRRGSARIRAGSVEDGFRDLNDALTHYRNRDGKDSRAVAVVGMDLCDAYLLMGRAEEARALSSEILETILRVQETLAGLEWGARFRVGKASRMLGKLDEAMTQQDRVLQITQQIYPPTHPEFIFIHLERGHIFSALGRQDAARTELEMAYTLAEPSLGASTGTCREIAGALAALQEQSGDRDGAERWRARAK